MHAVVGRWHGSGGVVLSPAGRSKVCAPHQRLTEIQATTNLIRLGRNHETREQWTALHETVMELACKTPWDWGAVAYGWRGGEHGKQSGLWRYRIERFMPDPPLSDWPLDSRPERLVTRWKR